jgi:amino acid transporter
MNPRVHLAIHILIAVAALAMLGFAFSQPLASLSLGDDTIQAKDDIYITKECSYESAKGIGNLSDCGDINSTIKPHMQAIMGVVIALIVCILLEFIGMNFGGVVSNMFGLLVLVLSITLIILLACG